MSEPRNWTKDDHHRGIVVGVDGSSKSKQALAWASRWARLGGEPLVAVAVWHYPSAYGWAAPPPVNFDPETLAKDVLETTVQEVLGPEPGIDLTTLVIFGRPAPVLVECSKEASLIVVGSRGRGEFAGMLLGSVSEFVVAHAHCPVVVVRDHEGADSEGAERAVSIPEVPRGTPEAPGS